MREILIVLIFILSIFLPLTKSIILPDRNVSTKFENRKLALFPKIEFNFFSLGSFPRQFETYYNDHFGLREALIYWHHYIKVKWLKKSPSPSVILAKKKWLFYGTEKHFDDYRGTIKLSSKCLYGWTKSIEKKRNWLKSKGIYYLYIIAPSKESIYPEYMPEYLKSNPDKTRLSQLIDYSSKISDINLIDLRSDLLEEKKNKLVYGPYSSHWNSIGAYTAYKAIFERMHSWFPDEKIISLSALRIAKSKRFDIDCARFIGMYKDIDEEYLSYELMNTCAQKVDFSSLIDNKLHGKECYGIMGRSCSKSVLRAIIFRDSFFTAIEPYFSEHFFEVVYLWMQYDQEVLEDIIKEFKPNIVIEEITERLVVPPVE